MPHKIRVPVLDRRRPPMQDVALPRTEHLLIMYVLERQVPSDGTNKATTFEAESVSVGRSTLPEVKTLDSPPSPP